MLGLLVGPFNISDEIRTLKVSVFQVHGVLRERGRGSQAQPLSGAARIVRGGSGWKPAR